MRRVLSSRSHAGTVIQRRLWLLYICCWLCLIPPERQNLLFAPFVAQASSASSQEVEIDATGDVTDDEDNHGIPKTCHSWTGAACDWEPNLKAMTVPYGDLYNETFYAYVTPDVSTFYNQSAKSRTPTEPRFNGQFGKFINLSPETVRVHWHSPDNGMEPSYIADIEPFGSSGTATFSDHHFVVTSGTKKKGKTVLTEWKIEPGNSLYYYDPFDSNPVAAKKALTEQQFALYHMQLQNRAFAQQYRLFTGTDWLALYKQKHPPRFHMWRADTIGQTHVVISSENHYTELPPPNELKRGTSAYGPRPDELGRMRQYRHQLPEVRLVLKALSCAPRVFEIQNFLSDVEVDHILQLAGKSKMQRSSTQAGEAALATQDDDTRTSRNSWISRNTDMITDAIHRRAADMLQINESLLRWRRKSEIPEFTESMTSIAEKLQLVHYNVGERTYTTGKFTGSG